MLAGTVEDAAILRFASIAADVPVLRRGGDKHFSRGRAGTPQGQPGTGNAAASARAVIINFWIGGCLFDADLLPIEIQLFGEDHGERGHGALAHFGFAEDECDAIVRRDAHPGVQGVRGLFFLILCRGVRGGWKMEGNDQRGASRGSGLEKVTAIQNGGSSHDAPRFSFGQEDCALSGFGFGCGGGRSAMDGFADALIGAAAADVAAHEVVDVGIGGIGFFG